MTNVITQPQMGLAKLYEQPDWWAEAHCRGMPSEIFIPADILDEGMSKEEVELAKAICSGCPVREKCLDRELTFSQRAHSPQASLGVFGGETRHGRDKVKRARKKAAMPT